MPERLVPWCPGGASAPPSSLRHASLQLTDELDLVPQAFQADVSRMTPPGTASPLPTADFTSPLSAPALTWYTSGGCWNLALALHEATGYPIEVYYRDGEPKHAYIVDGKWALDARGTNELRLVQAGAERFRTGRVRGGVVVSARS
jgi:hypothetical protein